MLGVTRRLALDSGLCRQGIIEVSDLYSGQEIWLSNAVRGFFRGTIMTDTETLRSMDKSEEINLAKVGASTTPDSRVGRAFQPAE